jgi:hypothetical protein
MIQILTLEYPEPERWCAALEELMLRGIGVKAESGRLTITASGGMARADVEKLINGWIEENLARRRVREERRERRRLHRVSRQDLEPLLGNRQQFRRRE